MMTTQKGGGGSRTVFERTPAWSDEFEAQLGRPGFFEEVRIYARNRAKLVARYRRIDDNYAEELLEDVLGDTFEGRTPWDPSRVDLKKHVRDTIKYRSRHHYKRARAAPHISIDKAGAHDRLELEITEHEQERIRVQRTADESVAELRVLATGDPEVLMLLDAYQRRDLKKADVLMSTGLSSRQYAAARARLHRLRHRLPSHLQPRKP